MISTDIVEVTTVVAVDPEIAFRIFSQDIDIWWRREPRFRFSAERCGTLRFEPGPDGRLVEIRDDPVEVFEVGRVTVWDPPDRLGFDFRTGDFAPGERTAVEVRFEPVPLGTQVTLTHSGWDELPPDHPVKRGLVGPAFTNMIGLWWADLLNHVRARALVPAEAEEPEARP